MIEAVQFTDDELSIPTIEDFMQANVVGNMNGTGKIQEIIIATLEGEMYAMKGDWIVKESFPTNDRKFYPCKPDIFEKTYEKVEDE